MKISSLLLFCILSWNICAQYDSEGNNKSRFRPGFFWYFTGYNPAIPGKVRKYDRLIFDVTYSDWNGDQQPFQHHWASIGLNTNLMFDVPIVKKNILSLGIGVCYGYQTIRHNQNLFVSSQDGSTLISSTPELSNFSRNSIIGHNFSIPIELRIRTKGWKHFKVHLGGKVGIQAGLKGKTFFNDGQGRVITEIPDIQRLTYSVHARIGIRNWAVFGAYHFNTMFSNPQSSQLNMLQMGLSVSVF